MMNKVYDKGIVIDLIDEASSERFARYLTNLLKAPLTLTFSGEIGAGKTTIIRAMLKDLGVKPPIKSPTFSLVETYLCQELIFHHFDLYRIHHEDELDYLGFRDYFTHQSVCCIEWPEHAGRALSKVDMQLMISHKGAGREMQIMALSDAGERILACLAGDS